MHRRSSCRYRCRWCHWRARTRRKLDDIAILAECEVWIIELQYIVDILHILVALITVVPLECPVCWSIWR
jgi:hypothetical protein